MSLEPRESPADALPMWNRREFVSLGASVAALLLAGCGVAQNSSSEQLTGERVIVVGAGPAGMTSAHLLRQQGVDVQVLEAGPTHGGRIRHVLDFADFPIPLGAEWVHSDPSILGEIVNDVEIDVDVELVGYEDTDRVAAIGADAGEAEGSGADLFGDDLKFVGSSWLDVFDRYVMPGIRDVIRYNTQVVDVDYSGDEVVLTDVSGAKFSAGRVIITVPLRLMQLGDISFTPALEADRIAIIEDAHVWSGLKAFFEFDEGFYPAAMAFPDSETDDGQRLFYDAAHGQDTDQHILGVFSVGAQAEAYQDMSDGEFVASVLADLDEIFHGAASDSYVRHFVQNWDDEPFARGAYLEDDAERETASELALPLGELVYFAGDAYTTRGDWSSVHAAVRSATDTVELMLG